MSNNNKYISVGRKLYMGVMAIFLVFAVSFIVFQQTREKQFKVKTISMKLNDYNDRMNMWLQFADTLDEKTFDKYVKGNPENNLRVTVIDTNGKVIYDNIRKDYANISNHSHRAEFMQAMKNGQGYTVERNSETLGKNYFYNATYFPDMKLVIRTALPYNNDLAKSLKTDQHYIWFAVIAILLLTILLYRFTNRLGQNIAKLRTFAWRADHNESLDTDDLLGFPNDELGEIAERIIKIYKRLKSTRREQDILKRQLTQNIAHELKTPVASIQGYLETILDNPHIDENTKQQFLQRSYAQAERLTSLLRDISTLNRLDDAPEMMDFEPVDIAALVAQIQKDTALELEKHHMTFSNQLPASIPIRGNKSMLYSVFRNLTDNAIAYAGDGTTITVSAEESEHRWHFTFKDNGVGIASEHLGRIFERFYRVDKGRSRKMGGTGLGLAIVKNAILLHEGNIKAKNNLDGGLCFEFAIRK